MKKFNIIAETNIATVVAEYSPVVTKAREHQSEKELEDEFVNLLKEQSYEYLNIVNEKDLIDNLRLQLENLNDYKFSDEEWDELFNGFVANKNDGIKEKTEKIQIGREAFKFDGVTKNIKLIDKQNIHNNKLQVINQYVVPDGKRKNRYDVTILVNGLPLVHIELKRRGVAIREAFNQINRYQEESFWSGCGLFEYIQIFVISNGTNTKYYSNSTRINHIIDSQKKTRKERSSNSFEFTSFWADAQNKIIPDLIDFTKTFFSRHTLLNILTKYCVFTADKTLLVMRPYQIVATERILNRILVATNYKQYGTVKGGGYIWHATGSGKTLTSFKTAQLATSLDFIDKVLFVVDRKDLDYQTIREYDRFQKGAANSNTSTKILKEQLENAECKIIITTIQKLATLIKKYPKHEAFKSHIVIIFDECHRSQFGKMHLAIVKNFKKYHLFGFTGTPIFSKNATATNILQLKTTEQVFGDRLHSYTIVDAINDRNVLKFKVDYIKTMDVPEDIEDEQIFDINREKVYADPTRVEMVTRYIIDNFDKKTYRNQKSYKYEIVSNVDEVVVAQNRATVKEEKKSTYVSGFNSIFAVSSIDMAKAYYNEFKKQMQSIPNRALKVGLIYSFVTNEEDDGILAEEDAYTTEGMDKSSKDFLESAIQDYNEMFKTNYDTSNDKFENYYKDVSLRVKNKELDLLIVVNMFLTGFDATTLNTLWVDKNLRMHGLIQAFSRTNRILNSVKAFGNIVCFRNLQKRTDEAIALFGDKDAGGIVLLKSFSDYYFGYVDEKGRRRPGYKDMIDKLNANYPLDKRITGENSQKTFVKLFGSILRRKNLLSSFDEFEGQEILSDRDFQNHSSRYLDIRDEWKNNKVELTNINEDIIFEIELLKQIEINIDYILMLVKQYHETNCVDKEVLVDIEMAVEASPELRSKKELIMNFINGVNTLTDVFLDWHKFVAESKEKALASIIQTENLKEKETRQFIDMCFSIGELKATGTDLDKIMPPISRFGTNGESYYQKRKNIIAKFEEFFMLFFGM